MYRTVYSKIVNLLVLLAFVLGFSFAPINGNYSFVSPAEAETIFNQSAIVLVNSASANFNGFTNFIRPYLDHFGVPYDVLDVVTEPVDAAISERALIIIGHRGLDPGNVYLDASEEAIISDAVGAGAGLVNFDNDLNVAGSARYDYVQTIFGFTYGAITNGSGVSFQNPAAHYIIERHAGGETISTGTMNLAQISSIPQGAEVLASTGSQPFLVAATYGNGRAVQFGSYDWMSPNVKGSLYGLDDTIWRSIVWAARKPFAIQGLPPLVTFRMDDANGPFWWVHVASEYGYKPWVGYFLTDLVNNHNYTADLAGLVNSGNATASVHAFDGGNFFFYDHNAMSNFDDATVASNFAAATQWHQANNIPISKFVLGHYYALGTNIFEELDAWGVEFLGTLMPPGQIISYYPTLPQKPFLENVSAPASSTFPFYYSDYMDNLGLPPVADKFFNCVTEIRDVAGYEWHPGSDINQNIYSGTSQLKRALDSMALATLFTHEYEFNDVNEAVLRASLQGINNNIADYEPQFVTMDYACQYMRAIYDSQISSVSYDSDLDRIALDFSGKSDMETSYYLFTEDGGQIQHWLLDVPPFETSTQVIFDVPGQLDHINVSPTTASVLSGATQQFTAQGLDANNRPIPYLTFNWSVVNGGGSILPGGLFTAGSTPGFYGNTVEAAYGGVSGYASVEVLPPALDHFTFAEIASPQLVDEPFGVTITAHDVSGNPLLVYNGTATLSDSTGTIAPITTGNFSNGVWSGQVTIGQLAQAVTITVNDGSASGTSNPFDVASIEPVCATIQRGTFGIVEDTMVWEVAPTSIYGTVMRLSTGDRVHPRLGPGETRSLLKFDLSFLPTGAAVQSATLGIYAENTSTEGVSVYRVTQDWNETNATWANKASAFDAGTKWSNFPLNRVGYLTTDLTALVASWAAGIHPNYGLMLINNGTGAYNSYRASERLENGAPWLEVCYLLSGPGEPVALQITPDSETIIHGESVSYQATAVDELGLTTDVTDLTSFSIDTGAGGSWAGNVYTSENPGDWTVTGQYEGLSDTASLMVLEHGPAVSIEIAPDEATVQAGESQAYTATASDGLGNSWDVTAETSFNIPSGAGGSWAGNVYTSQVVGDWTATGVYATLNATALLHVTRGAAVALVVTPEGETVLPGGSVSYQAEALDDQGNSWDVTGLTSWSAEVGAGGSWAGNVYTSDNPGTWQVTGTYDSLEDNVYLNVLDHGPAVSIAIAPDEATVQAGESQAYTATASDGLGNNWDVTGETSFSIQSGAGGGWVGNIYTSQSEGDWTVTGVYGTLNAAALLHVTRGAAIGVEITPAEASVLSGESVTYYATAVDAQGNRWDVTGSSSWSTQAGAGGSWAGNVYTSANTGDWTVTGVYGALSGGALLHVLGGAPTCVTIQRGSFGTVADTYMWEHLPNVINGATIRISTGYREHPSLGLGETRSLLHFDLSFLPAGAAIQSATLRIYAESASGEPVGIYRATEGWSEASATWASVGNAYDPAVEWSRFNVANTGYQTADLTALVAAWAGGTHPNYGMMLINNGAGAYDRYRSSERSGSEPSLQVCYVVSSSSAAPHGTAAIQNLVGRGQISPDAGFLGNSLVGVVGAVLLLPGFKRRNQ